MEHFAPHETIEASLLLTNNKNSGAIARAERMNVPVKIFNRNDFYSSDAVLEILKEYKINWIILAGFLWLIPENLLNAFPRRIVNIHPALLPKYGGKGMYGMNVHRAVIDAGERESGISIHYINGEYDRGDILFQATCPVDKNDTPENLAQKVHVLEYEHFPAVVEKIVSENK
jgi:phosphoribosylglycinamide formyltransferase-1